MNKRLAFLIFNVLGLEITWAACAYGELNEFPLLGVIVGSVYIVVHMILTPTRLRDILTLCALASIGILLDYVNMLLDIVTFNPVNAQHAFIPLWLVFLWCVFSLMIPHSLHWLRKRPLLASALGAVGGASSYWLGHKLGAITLSDPLLFSVGIYFVQWAMYVPLAYVIYNHIEKMTFNPESNVSMN